MEADRRYQVFVSSTFFDLKDERAAIVMALLEMDAFPAGMELFPAADEDAWTLIKRVIDSSDYYLLVIGGRYGSVDPDTELSYTEMEYDYAVEQRKPVMAFLHADPDKIELGKSEKDDQTREKLEAFRKKVKGSKHVKLWNGADDLAGKVTRSFASFRKNYPAVGWVRGDTQTSTEALSELNDLRKQLAEAERQLDAARTQRPAGTEELSQGKDLAVLAPYARIEIRLHGSRWNSQTIDATLDVAVTWDQIFSSLGPALLDEAEERAMRLAIHSWLTDRFADPAMTAATEGLKKAKRSTDEVKSGAVRLTDADFGTVLIQLSALGLIAKSEKKRSVSDTGTYWTLTPYGREHLTSLRALRREPESGEAAGKVDEAEIKFRPLKVGPRPKKVEDDIPF